MARPRSVLGTLRQSLGESQRPIWMLGAERRLIYGNGALEAWTQTPLASLLGQQCDFSWSARDAAQDSAEDHTPLSAICAALAAPPETWPAGGEQEPWPTRRRVVMPHEPADAPRDVIYVPLSAESAQSAVLAMADARATAGSRTSATTATEPEAAGLHFELGQLRRRLGAMYDLSQLIGESSAILRVQEQIRVAVAARSRVLVTGPVGSGREHVARTIHYQQARRFENEGALVPMSCALLDPELLQTTISSVVHSHPEIEIRGPVTFLLLDADQLTPEAQTALMAVLNIVELQVHTLTTSGGSLLQRAAEGEFRQDLAHHLSTMVIDLPPLEARREDIPLLAQKLLEDLNAGGNRQWSGFTPDAMDQLAAYRWPENLDEMAEVVRQACRAATSNWITPDALPERFHHASSAHAHPRRPAEPIVLDKLLADIEAQLLQRALRRAKGNRSRAARLLGISRARLIRRIQQLKISI